MADTPNIYEDETGAPEAAPINWAMTDWMTQLSAPNTSLNTNPEFLAAAEADYNRIHGEGAWAAHVESTRQDLQDDADSFWDFFDNGDEALAAFDPDELLTQWARNDFASERLRPEEQAREFQSYPRNVQDLIENGSSQDLMSAALHYATYASRGAIALQGFENGQMTPEAIETIRRDMDVYDGLSDKLWGLAAERIDADANISRLMADKNSAFLITGARGLARDNPNMNAEDIRDLGVMSAIYARVKGAAETGYSDNLAARIERQLLPPVDERSDADNALLAQVQELETFISTIPDDPSELVEATENFESREAMRSFFDDTAQNYGYDGSIFTQASRPTESELANNESFQKAAHILFERETGQSWDQAGGNNEYDAATIGEWGLEFMSEERNQLWEVISQAGSLYLSDSFTMDQKMAYMYASETFDLTRDDFGTFKRAAWNTITDEANVVSLAAAALSVVTGGASSAGVEAAKRAGQKGFMTAVRNQVMNETREAAA
ncbi:MAG: hypothetical protein CMH27_10290, partial [Micavibrio sp.]|nr:hypothetical protein [Micavibrio sp.]